jgi:DNA-binding LacI/PurR family transcriptional regulator
MLSKCSSKVIGVLLPSLSNQVFASFTQGIEAITNGYEIIIAQYSAVQTMIDKGLKQIAYFGARLDNRTQ